MYIQTHTIRVRGDENLKLHLWHTGPSNELEECKNIDSIKVAFTRLMESKLSRRQVRPSHAHAHARAVIREVLSNLRGLYAKIHPWVKNLEVHIG